MAKGFKDLIVWQKSYQLALLIYQNSEAFPKHEIYGLTQQMRRSAVSVPSNIAEGYGRQHNKEYSHFLAISYGSLCELETQYLLAVDLKYLKNDDRIEGFIGEVGRMLFSMMKPALPNA